MVLPKLINEIWCNNDVPNSIIRFSCLCVVLHPHQEPQKEASALLIHHQIGNFLIAASKFAFIGFSLPPLRAVRGEKKQASNCLTRPPIEPYWLDKAQLNSLQGNHQADCKLLDSYAQKEWFLRRIGNWPCSENKDLAWLYLVTV